MVTDTYFVEARDGTPLFARAWRPRTASRGALAIVHGLLDHGERYDALARRLAEAGFSVHAIDLRGHGRSGGMRVYAHDFADYVDDTERFVAAVSARESADVRRKLFLFGHSMGGAIAATFALDRPHTLAGLVLSAPAVANEKVPGLLKGSTYVTSALFPEAGVFSLELRRFSRDPAVVAACEADPLVYHSAAPARTAAGILGAVAHLRAEGSHLTLPLLVLHGTADAITEPEGSAALVARAASKDKRLVLYPGLVHDLLHEPEHAKVESDIAAWLGERAR